MAIAVVVAVAIGLIGGHELPDYDATFALIWGRDILHGHAPNYDLPFRPAGHPLTTFVGLVAAPLGRDGAADLLRWVALLGAGAFVASVFRLGQALFGTLAGALAALLLATRAPLWGFSELAFMDAWAAAFVVWAGVLELRVPRRGAAVFVLLGLAGLVRPEVWLFAAVYWVWIAIGSPLRALRMIPLAALAPLAWIAWDAATSQTFLGSVSTAEGLPVATSSGGHGLSRAPDAVARYIGGFVRPPELVAGVVGLVLTWRRAAIPIAIAALNVIAFAIVADRNGPLEQRYLLVASAVILMFAGYAIANASARIANAAARIPPERIAPAARIAPAEPNTATGRIAPAEPNTATARIAPAARIAGIVLALACLAYAPIDIGRIGDVRDQVRISDDVYSNLRAVVQADATRCALAGHVHVDDVRLRPFIAYWAAIPPERLDTDPGGSGTVVALDPVARELSSRSLPSDPDAQPKAPPFWRLDGSCARQ